MPIPLTLGIAMSPFNLPIKRLAKTNQAFRRELMTTDRLQVVLMALQPGEEIGLETHQDTDQFFYIVKGEGRAIVDGEKHGVEKGSMIVVRAGTPHNLINDGDDSLKLFTIYVPPHHPPGTVHATRAEAMAPEEAPACEITQ